MPPTGYGGGRFSVLADPQGATFGLFKSEAGWEEIKNDTGQIHWQTPAGVPYTLSAANGDQNIHNGEAYGLKLPRRKLIESSQVQAEASMPNVWYSGRGNDFGCTPIGGHNLDIALPELATIPNVGASGAVAGVLGAYLVLFAVVALIRTRDSVVEAYLMSPSTSAFAPTSPIAPPRARSASTSSRRMSLLRRRAAFTSQLTGRGHRPVLELVS